MKHPLWKIDFRKFKILFYKKSWPIKEIAKYFNASESAVVSFRQRRNLPPRGWAKGIHPMFGKKLSIEKIAKMSLVMKGKGVGKNNWNWKGGKYIDSYGYRRIKITTGNYIPEHRNVMEKHLKRKLQSSEIIHHKNGKKLDNRIENLQILSRSEHAKLHRHAPYFHS